MDRLNSFGGLYWIQLSWLVQIQEEELLVRLSSKKSHWPPLFCTQRMRSNMQLKFQLVWCCWCWKLKAMAKFCFKNGLSVLPLQEQKDLTRHHEFFFNLKVAKSACKTYWYRIRQGVTLTTQLDKISWTDNTLPAEATYNLYLVGLKATVYAPFSSIALGNHGKQPHLAEFRSLLLLF